MANAELGTKNIPLTFKKRNYINFSGGTFEKFPY